MDRRLAVEAKTRRFGSGEIKIDKSIDFDTQFFRVDIAIYPFTSLKYGSYYIRVVHG